ncbi:hypothetical protein AGDE_14054 [Angomonas deanei]|uniref:Uncharacterized protein n=1 Tax=Angomonas deanei TaxID=59799 RepID=A0A7G2CWT9_9TRYP|nr:hypothetical protein AGDE_14054 [Angomonas deanei]CAD2222923.1 hypothetical protein, conserved [Angomonas deanei]|eukprot:EPY21514.1 hypothetical protein AGDE_14054 [Angomonas deanei]
MSYPLVVLTVLFSLVSFTTVSAQLTFSTACECNNGLLLDDNTECQCLCFDGYLLPDCLYKANDNVSMELWIRGKEKPDTKSFLSGRQVQIGLATGFGVSDAYFEPTFVQLLASSVDFEKYAPVKGQKFSIFKVLVTMPGWAAQQLLADSVNNPVDGHLKEYCFMEEDDGTCGSPDAEHLLFYVIDRQPSPAEVPLFTDTWMRMYLGSTWYMSLEQCGWFFAAFLVVLFFLLMEQKCMHNVDYNVAGCAVKHYGVRQEVDRDDLRYRKDAKDRKIMQQVRDLEGGPPSRMASFFSRLNSRSTAHGTDSSDVSLTISPHEGSRGRAASNKGVKKGRESVVFHVPDESRTTKKGKREL